jgi:HD-GYP domain-containing protein (c-di-GMP phosphodiesterase class II)
MAQALLVSDHELLNDIYTMNFKAFLDVDVTIQKDVEQAFKLLDLSDSIHLIVCISELGGKDIPLEVYNHLKETNLDIPLVVIGDKSETKNNDRVITLPGNFNIKKLIKTIADILGVTARDMINKIVPEYYPIPLKMFLNARTSPCEIFHKVSKSHIDSEYIKFLEKDISIEGKMDKYLDLQIEKVYVLAQDRLTFVNMATAVLFDSLKNTTDPKEVVQVVEQGFEILADQLFHNPKVNEEMINISKSCVETIQGAVKQFPKFKKLIAQLLANKSGYLYSHSVMATYISNHIISEINWGSDEHAEKIGFVLFFHDIFLAPIYAKYPEAEYEEDLLFQDLLDEKEKEVVISHASLASDLIKSFPRSPMGADAIAIQHHGMTSGQGFAMQFKDDISPLAKVIIISEEFVNEMLRHKNDSEISVNNIVTHLRSKFPKHTYQKIIDHVEGISL